MRAIYFDCFAGASGDMILGALLDLGLDLVVLEEELRKLPLPGYRLQAGRVQKKGIYATSIRVILGTAAGEALADSNYSEIHPQHDILQTLNSSTGEHGLHLDSAEEANTLVRRLAEILTLLRASNLSESVKSKASHVFTRLAEAEGDVHGLPIEQVHFHEVGGVDAIVDIVGACIGLELLGVEAVYVSALHLGGGFVRSLHGVLPVPAPATALLLRGVPVYQTDIQGELVTPTGAAILTTLASSFGHMPEMLVQAVGCGAGTREREFPNVLRAFLGEVRPPREPLQLAGTNQAEEQHREPRDPFPEQHIAAPGAAGYHDGAAVAIEANLDDMPPQFYEHLLDKLLTAGALDALIIPAQMKKNRPGVLLYVMAHPESVEALLQIIFMESTTIGARSYPVTKHMLQRQVRMVQTPYGVVSVKLAYLGERLVNSSPEYEDCRRLAEQLGVPLKEIWSAAQAAARAD